MLQTAILETTLPVLGDVKLVTSLFFDIGVYLVVVGLVLDILRSLGAELDRQVDEDDPIDAEPGRGDRPMTPTVVLPVIIGGLYAAGVYLLLDRSLTRVLIGFLLLGNATNLLLLSAGGSGGPAPILGYAEPDEMSDPLPQALILTAIVITFGISAFVLAMIYRSWRAGRQTRSSATTRRTAAWRAGSAPTPTRSTRTTWPRGPARRHADSLAGRRVETLRDGTTGSRPTTSRCPLRGGRPVICVLTPLPVLLPLLGAAVALLVGGRHPRTQRTLSIAVLTAVLAVVRRAARHRRRDGPAAVVRGRLAGAARASCWSSTGCRR